MAKPPYTGPCHWCRGLVDKQRVTVPRDKTGDLVFDAFACLEAWREEQLLETIVEE